MEIVKQVIAWFILALLLVVMGCKQNEFREERPNILILMADDWNWPHSAGVEAPNIRTPTFDRIASEGVSFKI